jgi:hypothetical protein
MYKTPQLPSIAHRAASERRDPGQNDIEKYIII